MGIEIRNLTKRYGSVTALDNLTLDIKEGMFGLLGPNGAGKTTLMRIMATVLYPTEGTVLLDGYDVGKNPEEVRKMIGYLPQSFGFYPNVRLGDFLSYVGVLKGMDRHGLASSVDLVLEMVNLADRKEQKIKTLSGGMKQRLGIAQAFLGDPEILIVDEPTAGLDPEERVRFRKILTEMSIGKRVILSTHIAGDIEASCSEVGVLDGGTIQYSGGLEGLVNFARGMIWELEIPVRDYQGVKDSYDVLNVKRSRDFVQIQVMSPEQPSGSTAVEPQLEAGYLCLLNRCLAP